MCFFHWLLLILPLNPFRILCHKQLSSKISTIGFWTDLSEFSHGENDVDELEMSLEAVSCVNGVYHGNDPISFKF